MNKRFFKYIEGLDAKVDLLLSTAPHKYSELPRGLPRCGIYLFSDGPNHLYVGRSNRIRGRLASHCRDSSRHNAASFAFRIARIETGRVQAAYNAAGSRAKLSDDPQFARAFREAKAFLRTLDIRFVEEAEQTTQALLEIYAAVRLETPYNEFRTH
jgi:excinuclease UvrABC nuclease subunit